MNALAQLFCPTHNSSYTDKLAYYKQREWRIISDLSIREKPTSRELTIKEKETLLHINSDFFEKSIETINGQRRRIDECRLYINPSDKHPLTRATAVIVPTAVLDETKKLLAEAGFQLEVLPFEEQFTTTQ